MKNKALNVPVIYLLTFFTACNPIQVAPPTNEFPLAKKKVLDNFSKSILNSLPLPGIAIGVVQKENVYFSSQGKLDISENKPINDSTVFFTGSISEVMVATAIVKLAQSKKINLDDPIAKHLPYFRLNGNYKDITVRHLLTQTGGIPAHSVMWDLPEYGANALENTTRSISDQPPHVSPPGNKIKRSPYNFDILADLISKASGMSFEQYAHTHVFTSLKMTSASFNKPKGNVARPHLTSNWLTYAPKALSVYPYNREHAGSIGLNCSIADLNKWMYMLLNDGKTPLNTFLNKKYHAELMRMHYQTSQHTYIGFGWEIGRFGRHALYRKSHHIGGFSGELLLLPEERTGVVVLSNLSSEDLNIYNLGHQLLSWSQGNQLGPVTIPVHLSMGRVLAKTGSLDSAIKHFIELSNVDQTNHDLSMEALSQLGINLLYRLDNIEQGIKVFEFAANRYPSRYTQLNLAEAYLRGGRRSKAIIVLRSAQRASEPSNASERLRIIDLQKALASSEKKISTKS